jgi:hypothetical protein
VTVHTIDQNFLSQNIDYADTPSPPLSDMQKQKEIENFRKRWQQLDISSKDAFFKEMEDHSDLKWEDVVEEIVPAINDAQVINFPF